VLKFISLLFCSRVESSSKICRTKNSDEKEEDLDLRKTLSKAVLLQKSSSHLCQLSLVSKVGVTTKR
jgi:hypothetical protein